MSQPPPNPPPSAESNLPSAAMSADEAKRALEAALDAVQDQRHAEQVIADLHRAAGNRTLGDVARQTPTAANAAQAAHRIAESADASAPERRPQAIIEAAAAQVAAYNPLEGGALDESVLRAINPPLAEGPGRRKLESKRSLLRRALLKQMKPFQQADTAIFLDINHLPHPRFANVAMRWLTIAMKRADAMALGLFIAALRDPERGSRALAQALPALWITTATIEVPVKHFFRRRRPFIDVVRAIVVGRRPGSFSFPSGHSAAAFAGAALLRKHYPRATPALYLLAVLVGFSRIYLGAHYPADVLTGGLGGTVLAETTHALWQRPSRKLVPPIFRLLRGLRWLIRS